jgi:hypothetical protein
MGFHEAFRHEVQYTKANRWNLYSSPASPLRSIGECPLLFEPGPGGWHRESESESGPGHRSQAEGSTRPSPAPRRPSPSPAARTPDIATLDPVVTNPAAGRPDSNDRHSKPQPDNEKSLTLIPSIRLCKAQS